MARSYSINGSATTNASGTLPLLTVISTAAVRTKIYDVVVGSDATPADNTAKFQFQRCTTAGTAGSSITPQPLDTGDAAAVTTAGLAVFSVGPNLTGSAFLLQFAVNQRATFRWVASPGKEMVCPATASSGIALMNPVVGGSNYNCVMSLEVEE